MNFSDVTVVVPVDFSPQSEFAIRSGLSISGDPRKLHVIFVRSHADSIAASARMPADYPVLDFDIDGIPDLQERLKTLVEQQEAQGAVCMVLDGDPGRQIAEYAARIKADLIVIPSHGYNGLKRLVLGSVAETVIRHASCSVLVLRRPDAE